MRHRKQAVVRWWPRLFPPRPRHAAFICAYGRDHYTEYCPGHHADMYAGVG